MTALRARAQRQAEEREARGERTQVGGMLAVGGAIAAAPFNPAIAAGIGSFGSALVEQGAREKQSASGIRAKAAAVERLARGSSGTDGRAPGQMMGGLAPPSRGGRPAIWPPIGDTISVASYAAMTAQASVAPLSTTNSARTIARAAVDRGRDLATGARDAATTRFGKAADQIATRTARLADTSRIMDAARGASESRAGRIASKAFAVAGKVALPLMVAKAGVDAALGFQRDGARGAALGAIDSVAFGRGTAAYNGWKTQGASGAMDALTFGMMSWAAKHLPESIGGTAHAAPAGKLDAREARQFEAAEKAHAANQRASASRQQNAGGPPSGSGLRGTQNPTNMAAVLAAQGKQWSGDYMIDPQPGRTAK